MKKTDNTETKKNLAEKVLNNSDPENRFKSMSAEKKLELSQQLYYSARELKLAWLKQQHPEWSETLAEFKLKEIFLYART